MNYVLPFDHPLLPDFTEYVFFDGFLPHEIDRIIDIWDHAKAEKATVTGDQKYNDGLRKSSVIEVIPDKCNHWIYERIGALAGSCNAERYRFELNGFLEPLQLTEYRNDEFFDWHMDFSAGEVSHRKLSVTVQLSDENSYEGGDLQFMLNNRTENAPRKIGTVVIFPSFIQHRVTKVIKGKRNSIVAWLSGPPYR